jgi:hypothetical protein
MDYIEINPEGITSADIVVGIPSWNEASSIAFTTQQSSSGLVEFFPGMKSVIINCDNNSEDGTKESFLETETAVPKIYISTPPGVRGKGNNLRNLFYKVCRLEAKACVVVDADLKSITPQWIKSLCEPVLHGFGFVTPLYIRHKLDGALTNNVAYPLIRSLYGRRVRQPIGGDFGFSGELARTFLEFGFWTERTAQFGIDVWMTVIAICRGVQISQAFLGNPKVHRQKGQDEDLGPLFRQILGTIFDMMCITVDSWRRVRWSRPTAIFGFGTQQVQQPPPVEIKKESLYEKFHQGVGEYKGIWERVFTAENMAKLKEVMEMDPRLFDFPSDLWAKVLFDLSVAYAEGREDRELLLTSVMPLYYGKTYSFVLRTEEMSTTQAEEYLEDQCMVFEEAKPYLIERWPGS